MTNSNQTNENASVQENTNPIENETSTGKCDNCGAEMEYDPKTAKLKCPYCGFEKEIENARNSTELDFSTIVLSSSQWGDETHVFRCNNCGAKEVISKHEIAKECPFCGTTNIVCTDELSGLKPNGVVPFAITVKNACERVVAWAKKKIFAPTAFKDSVKPEKVRGIYNPAFTFDTRTFSTYSGRLGKYYTRTVRRNGKTYTERELRYFYVSGNHEMMFDDVLVNASTRIAQSDLNKIKPFDTNDSREYSIEYLHGYSAQQYEKDGQECWNTAKKIIDDNVRSKILSRYDYDVVSSLNVSTVYNDVTYKYLLLPLYVGHCNWKNKLYNFFVNGRNGKVTGKTPVSVLKVLLAVGIGLVVVGGIIFGIYMLSQSQ